MSSNITPEMIIDKIVVDINDEKVGIISDVIEEKYKKISMHFIEVALDKKMPWGFKDKVKIRTTDSELLDNGHIKVKYTKKQLKIMATEQKVQKHPPHN
ncbi:MAG: hypothetical protein EU542_07585 [Promethearchaeota archaeon]|jgi:hypothetical protein|nr:MAG: hypothetical protein EU542_07585 [Candidatus Lokiarchaeota archaeon]